MGCGSSGTRTQVGITAATARKRPCFVPRLVSLGHEVLCAAPYSFGGNSLDWQGIKVFGCARDGAGNDTISNIYEYTRADLILTVCDVFGLLKAAQAGVLAQMNVAHWSPVDADPLGEGDLAVLRDGRGIPIAISHFGEEGSPQRGHRPPVRSPLRGHGDLPAWRPRAVPYSIPQIGPDTFVIGIAAMNRDHLRKGLTEQFQAFARFHRRHPDSHLALHTAQVANPGINLTGLTCRLGISAAISYPDAFFYDMGLISEEQMATWYNGLDVLSLCSFGEGFGLPLIEAQACGIPVITNDASATTELCGAGWLTSASDFWANNHVSFWRRPDVSDIDAAYEMAWEKRQDGKLPKKEAEDFGKLFDADKVFSQYWVPVLKELEKRIGYAGSDVSG